MDSYREIENLIYQAAWTIDEGGGPSEACREIFKYCTLTIPDTGEQDLGPNLATSSEKMFKRWAPDDKLGTSHRISNVWIEVDEEAGTAKGRSYLMMMQAVPRDGFPLQAIGCGIYHDTFKRIDGKWWFDTHRLDMKLMGDISRHVTAIDNLPLLKRIAYRLTMMFPFLQRLAPQPQ